MEIILPTNSRRITKPIKQDFLKFLFKDDIIDQLNHYNSKTYNNIIDMYKNEKGTKVSYSFIYKCIRNYKMVDDNIVKK
jgi:hypothetical protein